MEILTDMTKLCLNLEDKMGKGKCIIRPAEFYDVLLKRDFMVLKKVVLLEERPC